MAASTTYSLAVEFSTQHVICICYFTHLILLGFIVLIIFDFEEIFETPDYKTFPILLLLPLS
jgi:hypothetical protein